MNRALEFHDSGVASVSTDEICLTMSFSEAYVHSSSGIPGVSPGDGYVQPAKLVFSQVSWSGPISEAAGPLSDGVIRLDRKNLSLLPLPFQAEGDITITAEFTFVSGVRLSVQARAVRCSAEGDVDGWKRIPANKALEDGRANSRRAAQRRALAEVST